MVCRYQISGFITTSTILTNSRALRCDSQTGSLQQPWVTDYRRFGGGLIATLIANQLVKDKKPNNMENNSILWLALVCLLLKLLL